MKSFIAATVMVALVASASFAFSQTVVTYYPSGVPVTTYYGPSPRVPVTTYYAPVTRYYAPVTTYYAPAVTAYYSPAYIVRPKVYVRGQPIRNVLRAITP
jgi:hypothetical protein